MTSPSEKKKRLGSLVGAGSATAASQHKGTPAATAAAPALDWDASVPIITTLKEYERFVSDLHLSDNGREKAIAWFNGRVQQDKASAKALSKAGAEAASASTSRRKENIKTPGYRVVDEEVVRTPYRYTPQYVKTSVYRDYMQPLRLSTGDQVHYDVSHEDCVFLDKLYKDLSPLWQSGERTTAQSLEESFVRLINVLETNTAFGPPVTADVAVALAKSIPTMSEVVPAWAVRSIHKHWMERRALLQKPLLRRYWGAGPVHQPPAFVVFQTRLQSRDRMALRRPKRSLQEAASKFDSVLTDLKRVERLMRYMLRRDRQKMLIAELNGCIFDQMRREFQDPTYVSPHWLYLKKTKFGNCTSMTSDARSTVEKWLDGLMDPMQLPDSQPPAVIDVPEISIPPTAIRPLRVFAAGGGKSVPGQPISIPIFEKETHQSIEYTEDDGDAVLFKTGPQGYTQRATMMIDNTRMATIYQAEGSVDPAPPRCSIGGRLIENPNEAGGNLIHGLRQCRFLQMMDWISLLGEKLKNAPSIDISSNRSGAAQSKGTSSNRLLAA